MLAFIPVVALAAFAPAVSALSINEPNGSPWLGNSTNRISWSFGQDDVPFSIELGNTHLTSGLLSQGPIAVGNNIQPNTQHYDFLLPVLPAGDGYFVAFVGVSDINTVYANSSLFSIIDNPTSTSYSLSSFSTKRATSGTNTRTSTARNSTSTGTATSTGSTTGSNTNTVISQTSSFTTLAITTPTPSSTSTTTTGAATRAEAAWYVGFVTALLGAILA